MIDVLWAVLVLALLGLICAVLLSLAQRFFGEEQDERFVKVRECLPGANCGACGFSGCDAYAKAIVEGEKSNLCIPGGDGCAANIAEVLGCEAMDVFEMVAYVNCNGNCSATEKAFEGDGKTCLERSLIYGGDGSCKWGCLGCGDCTSVCPTSAISICNGVAHVDESKCIGCGLCARTCPKNIISIIPLTALVEVVCSSHDKGADVRRACKNGCIACGKCEKTCKYGAIKVIDNLAVIDYNKCTACGECVAACPVKCISDERARSAVCKA